MAFFEWCQILIKILGLPACFNIVGIRILDMSGFQIVQNPDGPVSNGLPFKNLTKTSGRYIERRKRPNFKTKTFLIKSSVFHYFPIVPLIGIERPKVILQSFLKNYTPILAFKNLTKTSGRYIEKRKRPNFKTKTFHIKSSVFQRFSWFPAS